MKRLLVCAVFVTLACASASAAISDKERNALLAIYNATDGTNWQIQDGWGGPPGTECNWSRVACDQAQSTVTGLILSSENLRGTIPVALADLANLENLDMSLNALSGPIPPELGRLSNLKVLHLSLNSLSGTIPPSLGTLANLTDLELDSNQLTGTIPPELGNLAQLETLNLSVNQLGGTIPIELMTLSKLTNLDLGFNGLTGTLPDFAAWRSLGRLALNGNGFTGSIPTSIGQLVNLDQLFLQSNKLTGSIPPQIGNLTRVRDLGLGFNQLSGIIPTEVFSLTNLETLDLGVNNLTGTLSPSIGRLTKLQSITLGRNQLTGPLPAELTSFSQLDYLDLSSNTFTGIVPADIDRLASLRILDLGDNRLQGTIPPSLGKMQKLELLGLYQNQLTGTIPPQLASATLLGYVDIHGNSLTGTIPDSFRTMKNLGFLYVSSNQLSGPLPDWLPELPNLRAFLAHSNAFTGTIPPNVTSVSNLYYLDIGSNQLTGPIPSDIGKLQKLAYLTLEDNEFTGPVPDSFWTLGELVDVRIGGLHLTGTLQPAIRNLSKLFNFDIHDNDLSGPLPLEIGTLSALQYLALGGNRFTGTLPRELGQLKKLQAVDFSANNFRSPIPAELTGMTGIVDGGADFAYNALATSDPVLNDFMNRKQFDHDFARSQTVTPAALRVTQTTDRSALVEWTPIAYQYDEGGYRVFASLTQGGTAVVIATTSSKEISSITVRGLQPSTTYFFSVAAVTHPHDFQRNLVLSDISASVSGSTGPRQLAPAEVVLTATPTGLVQLDGVPQNEDSFTLTNFGDVATDITLEKFDSDFFDISPLAFTLAGGASQTVKVTSIPKQPAGVRYGGVVPRGTGTSDQDIVTTTLLSATRAGGNAIAEALTSRVEIAGDPGSDSVGQVSFRNKGTAALTGILVADVPWLVPDAQAITIAPGDTLLVRFKVVRARRPSGLADGTLTGTLSLIYVGALPASEGEIHAADTTPPPGISISKVTVVDVSKPDVGSGNAPQLAANEVAYFIAGLTSRNSGTSALASDLHVGNAFGSKPVNDLRLYYSSSTINAVANLTALASSQSVTLANIVSSVYGTNDQLASLQVRSTSWQNLVVNATLLHLVSGAGTFAGDMPVFRSDRALKASEKLYLTGIHQTQSVHASVVLEEIAGNAADVFLNFVDSAGVTVPPREVQLPPFGTAEVTDVPPTTATIVVMNSTSAPPSGVLAYARMSDDGSGDTWSVVDWSRLYHYFRNEPVRVPLMQGGASSGGKRRAVVHDTAPRAATSISLFNPGSAEARAALSAAGLSREVSIPARQTLTIADAGSFLGVSASQSLVISPLRGELAVTSRIASVNSAGGSIGTAMPVVAAGTGLRVGQGQIFAGLEDSSAYRTDYGFVESGGSATTIRATLLLSDARTLFTTVISRDFRLDANGFVFINDLVKSILGPTRNTQYGDLHNLQLQVEVTDGSGSILPFVVMTDNATGDATLRLE